MKMKVVEKDINEKIDAKGDKNIQEKIKFQGRKVGGRRPEETVIETKSSCILWSQPIKTMKLLNKKMKKNNKVILEESHEKVMHVDVL